MTTGSLCLTEILKSWKSCSSKSPASHSADSASASGVALPYLSMIRLSSEPALTPIRIEVPWAFASWAISLTWSSNLRMLPGLTRTAAQPASMAAKTYFGWKWMSAITGICECWAICGSASASSWDGQATRTMSQPVAVSSAICWRVALTSAVSVVVIDCTEIGESLPTPTLPTWIWRVLRRGASTGGGASGIPRLTAVMPSRLGAEGAYPRFGRGPTASGSGERDGHHEVADDQHHAHHQQEAGHDVRDGEQPGHVDVPGVGAAAKPGDRATRGLPQGAGDVAAVERQQRHEVEQADEEVEARDQAEEADQLLLQREVLRRRRLTGEPTTAHDADRAVGRPWLHARDRLGDPPDLDRQGRQRDRGLLGQPTHLLHGVDRSA